MRFLVPWIPAAKKNDVTVVPVRMGGRVIHRPVPSARIVREEHAIGVLFSAFREADGGKLPVLAFDKVRALCRRRASGGEGIGEKRLDEHDHGKGQSPMIADGNDVAMSVTIAVGAKKAEDRVVVEVSDRGPPPKRRRTGRRRDAINVPAIIADALKGRAFKDDRDVVALSVRVVHD